MAALAPLHARALTYGYRHCPSCRKDWPAEQQSCLECRRWLGERPLERTEWQLFPEPCTPLPALGYQCVAATAVVLRIVSEQVPGEILATLAQPIGQLFSPARDNAMHAVADQGWLFSTFGGPRLAFGQAIEFQQRLTDALPKLGAQLYGARLRWGMWTDQFVLSFDRQGVPLIPPVTARAIFGFEPDDGWLSSEAVYVANRRREELVGVPRRLLNGQSSYGFHWLGHKRTSAADHAAASESSSFTARKRELELLDRVLRTSAAAAVQLAIIARAGSGKTRLAKEWLRRNHDIRYLAAGFSLFGGDVASFARQLAPAAANTSSADEMLEAVLADIHGKRIQVLFIDDIHFADAEGGAFLRQLMERSPTRGMLVLLASRPSGRALVDTLKPSMILVMRPLSASAARRLAEQSSKPGSLAAEAARRSSGNPLFIEQFLAWARETGYKGGRAGPRTLQEVISQRIAYLSRVRIKAVRSTLLWGQPWQRQEVNEELDRLEAEIGLWLDRLETGDYADRVQAARYLFELEKVDYDIFLASTIARKPRSRSSRLREAIERLMLGAAAEIIADLEKRAKDADGAERANILNEAARGARFAYDAFRWPLALQFYELALGLSSPGEAEALEKHLAECRRRTDPRLADQALAKIAAETPDLEHEPAVDYRRLPEVWLQLGRRYSSNDYLRRAVAAAEAINDEVLAAWVRQHAEEQHIASAPSNSRYRTSS